MIHQENQAMIINTGSKQGITNPPYVSTFFFNPVLQVDLVKKKSFNQWKCRIQRIQSCSQNLDRESCS